jgi:hypothetical protein
MTVPLRLITLHFGQRRFTDDETRMTWLPLSFTEPTSHYTMKAASVQRI